MEDSEEIVITYTGDIFCHIADIVKHRGEIV